MADQNVQTRPSMARTSGNAALAFVVGALLALVAILAYVIFGSGVVGQPGTDVPASINAVTSSDSAAAAGGDALVGVPSVASPGN